jgi:hypothetical protein
MCIFSHEMPTQEFSGMGDMKGEVEVVVALLIQHTSVWQDVHWTIFSGVTPVFRAKADLPKAMAISFLHTC